MCGGICGDSVRVQSGLRHESVEGVPRSVLPPKIFGSKDTIPPDLLLHRRYKYLRGFWYYLHVGSLQKYVIPSSMSSSALRDVSRGPPAPLRCHNFLLPIFLSTPSFKMVSVLAGAVFACSRDSGMCIGST